MILRSGLIGNPSGNDCHRLGRTAYGSGRDQAAYSGSLKRVKYVFVDDKREESPPRVRRRPSAVGSRPTTLSSE